MSTQTAKLGCRLTSTRLVHRLPLPRSHETRLPAAALYRRSSSSTTPQTQAAITAITTAATTSACGIITTVIPPLPPRRHSCEHNTLLTAPWAPTLQVALNISSQALRYAVSHGYCPSLAGTKVSATFQYRAVDRGREARAPRRGPVSLTFFERAFKDWTSPCTPP